MTVPVAIVGLGGLFPSLGQPAGPEQLWDQVCSGLDTSREPPPGRWLLNPAAVYQSHGPAADRVYSLRACFLDPFTFDPAGLAVDAALLNALDPLVSLTLRVGVEAWRSARTAELDRARVGVILGNIALPTEGVSALAREILGNTVAEQIPGSQSRPFLTDPRNRYVTGLGAGILARALGLGGTCFTLDAACASSLYALALGCAELETGRADAMLVGGVSRPDSLYTQMGFAQLRALSTTGRCYPFDKRACGLVVGEGGGIFVLKRLDDALRQGDRIQGVIAGFGLSNDIGGGLLAPSSSGQLRALRLAYQRAGWAPADVDLIECHATGTPVGDQVEITSLRTLWGEQNWQVGQCVLSSVKSTVGHLLTAAGAAGLTKVLFALQQETLPPTANFAAPPPGIDLTTGPFRVLQEPEPWARRDPYTPRRAAISGFGFGGINAHLLLEEWLGQEESQQRKKQLVWDGSPEPSGRLWRAVPQDHISRDGSPPSAVSPCAIAIIARAAQFGPWSTLDSVRERLLGGRGDVEPTPPRHWWGVLETQWFRQQHETTADFAGYYLGPLDVRLDQFRIPPRELEELLPQQLLMLQTAAEVLERTHLSDSLRERTGVFIGLALDLNTTQFSLRWSLEPFLNEWATRQGLALDSEEFRNWVKAVRDAVTPALNANRTVGALGSIAASRIAREYHLGGPSFTVSSEETAGLNALETAIRALQRGDIDLAVVGAVDLAGDVRAVLGSGDRSTPIGEGAAAFLLKRRQDAERDGDLIHATIQGIGTASDEATARNRACVEAGVTADSLGHVETRRDTARTLGDTGAASGLASVLRACLALEEQILPDPARFWLHDLDQGPRHALVSGHSTAGTHGCVVLEECSPVVSHAQPLGKPKETLLIVTGNNPQEVLARAEQLAQLAPDGALTSLARAWPAPPAAPLALAVVARHGQELRDLLQHAPTLIQQPETPLPLSVRDQMFWSPRPLGPSGRLAFIFPGSGNDFVGMGRDLSVAWPDILRKQQHSNRRLRRQYMPQCFWDQPRCVPSPHERLGAQVALGTLVTDLLVHLGIRPDAALGYSLGESTALFALQAWTDRTTMFSRLEEATLFRSDLVGPCTAARSRWHLPADEEVDWLAGVVSCHGDAVRYALSEETRAYLLIINTPGECVIGGQRSAVLRVVERLGADMLPLPEMAAFHCPVVRMVADAYREMHVLPTTAPTGVAFYSGALGHSYEVTRESAADAVLAQALDTLDFPALVRTAYEDGVRLFVEVGPGGSCSRMITTILGERPHRARSACVAGTDGVVTVLRLLALLAAERVPMDLQALYGPKDIPQVVETERCLRVALGGEPFRIPAPPARLPRVVTEPARLPRVVTDSARLNHWMADINAVFYQVTATEAAHAKAHEAYLRFNTTMQESMASTLAFQTALLEGMAAGGVVLGPPRSLDRSACLEFAVGSIGHVLGPDYAAIDAFPTRVRLPDEPLMLVDRILSIEGKPLVLSAGRIVTEHTIRADAWYLDHGRIPTCIAVEAGQADLFLSGYLGIDLHTRGLAVYRLLDAVVTFHRGLPGPDQVILYDIHIERFLRQGETILFRFHFEGSVDGEPLLTMTEGCAGFFTADELAAGKGVVQTTLDLRPQRGIEPDDAAELPPCGVEAYSCTQIEALRQGNLAAAFGPVFAHLSLQKPLRLPGGRMHLVDRVTHLDPRGGRFGVGQIRAEADIHPDDWFLTCHFVDDQVMPGTLMFECCLHTLRILLMRRGWVGEHSEMVFEPVPGIASQLKCRGQVTARTRTVCYEVTIKERGYRPQPYVIGDALMIADGKPVVEIRNLSLQLTGLSRERLRQIWGNGSVIPGQAVGVLRGTALQSRPAGSGDPAHLPNAPDEVMRPRPALYGPEQIRAFSNGKPSEAFGEPYRIFDSERVIARLPGPPYQFLDRVVGVQGEPWQMVAGAVAEAEYDVPVDAWYFAAERQELMPFAILLEVALQPCGWLAAYVGSALTSPTDLSFRNLGGHGEVLAVVGPQTGTLSTRVKLTRVAHSAGMIIQNYDFEVSCQGQTVYRGDTVFGFFSKAALAQQVGLREVQPYVPSTADMAAGQTFPYPDLPCLPDERLRMIDTIELLALKGGPTGQGLVRGIKAVRPEEWFFQAHFFQDPVIPGSLGLESILQLLKVLALERWGVASRTRLVAMRGRRHSWQYRGQVIPTNRQVLVQAVITGCNDQKQELTADGLLWADGKVIYQMTDFTLERTDNLP